VSIAFKYWKAPAQYGVEESLVSGIHEGKDRLPQARARQSPLRSEKRVADLPVAT